MKNIIITALFSLCALLLMPQAQAQEAQTEEQTPAQTQEDMAKRLEAARGYEELTPVTDMIDILLAGAAKNPQFNLTEEDIAVAKSSVDMEKLREYVVSKMAQHFTESELHALVAFYGSTEGRSILAKFPAYTADVMPYIQMVGINAAMTAMQKKNEALTGGAPGGDTPEKQ